MPVSCTLVMPAYNEEECIEQCITLWLAELSKIFGTEFRFIVINDGSKDNTKAILDMLASRHPQLMVVHQVNQGHGATVLNGYKIALEQGSDYIFQTDSDNQFMPSDFIKLWDRRSESKFIIGRRKNRHDALHRLVISRIAAMLVMLLFGVRIKDSNVPFRLMQSGFLKELLPLLPAGVFIPNICLSIAAAVKKQPLLDIPVGHLERKTGQVSIVKWRLIKACIKSFGDLLRFRANLSR
jgi:dolichol-phosphate mannosyltransferase